MTLKELVKIQQEFDSSHTGRFDWDKSIDDDSELLGFLVLCLCGEAGEAANLVKKIIRGDFTLSEKKTEVVSELADVMIYLLKLSYQLGFDLEEECIKKIDINKGRFAKYEK